MNETNEIIEVKKPSRYQMLKMKVSRVAMRIIPVSMVLGVMGVGNAAATSNGTINFTSVVNTIEAVTPIFGALQDLVVAVVPYILTLAVVGGLIVLIKGLFSKGLNWK